MRAQGKKKAVRLRRTAVQKRRTYFTQPLKPKETTSL